MYWNYVGLQTNETLWKWCWGIGGLLNFIVN